jgi:hypothetical protein
MTEEVREPTQVELATRRTILTRDLKAICAMVTVPVIVQMMAPTSALARGDRGFFDWDEGGDHDRGEGRGHGRGDGDGGGHGACFQRGTKISTATGERRIEDLAIGDLVPTVFGGTRPIQWIGRFRRIRSDLSKPWAKDARPVRIARSALAPNIPHSDLYVTQGHALLVDGLLVPAGSLVNDTTISLYAAEEYDELEFFHIKLETHDAIYAEGAPCETLLRLDETMSNSADDAREQAATEAQDVHCAPIVCNGPRRELKTRVRSLMSPWLGPQEFDNIRARLELRAVSLV